jgi:hypothetical protein
VTQQGWCFHAPAAEWRAASVRRLTCQRCVVGLVTGGGSQLPLPWSKGAPCCWADAGAGAAPARTAAIVSMIDSLVTTNSFAASALKGNAARRDEVPRPRSSAGRFPTVPELCGTSQRGTSATCVRNRIIGETIQHVGAIVQGRTEA